MFWYNEGQGIEDPFRVIKIVRRDASNEQLIEQIISEIGSNPGSMPEGIGRIHDAGGARAIGGADNGVDAVASWKDKGDDRTDVPSYGKDGVISEQVGNNKIVHSMPVGWNGLIFKEKFRKSDFKFKSKATQDEVAEHRALDKRTTRLAPNGKRSNLTDRQYDLVRTKEFKDWFGDWENDPANASKVVDENGEPLVVYHGSFWDPLAEEPGKGKRKGS